MKKLCSLVLVCLLAGVFRISAQNNVGIGTANPDPSAILDLEDTQKGLLLPQLTTTQRLAIAAPANGLMVYDKTLSCVYYYVTGTGWQSVCNSGGAGVTGATGNPGAVGATGATGITGPTGVGAGGSGVTGATGPSGVDGVTGATGIAGASGATGATGPDWTLTALTLNPSGTLTLTTTAPQTVSTTVGAWLTTGNTGTTPPTNFIGTTDNIDWVMKTNSVERARVKSNGQFIVNNPTPAATDVFSVYSGPYPGTITGGAGVIAIAGYASGTNTAAVSGTDNTANGTGILGQCTGNLVVANVDQSAGVLGLTTGTNAANTFSFGVVGQGTQLNSSGVVGSSNTAGIIIPTGGAGGAFTSDECGVYGDATTVASGVGIVAVGNGMNSFNEPTVGAGLAGSGVSYGVAGYASTAVKTNPADYPGQPLGTAGAAGGYFEVDKAGLIQTWAYVGVLDNVTGAGTLRKIIGPGTVNTIVKDMKDSLVALSCPETPENLFQDFGTGTLVGGRVHITIDPIFAKNIVVNNKHELRVMVQLEGDCNGVYVTNKTATGFDVVELAGGKSNVKFSYMISANRADEVLADGSISHYSSERFVRAPGPQPSIHGTAHKAPGFKNTTASNKSK